MKPRAYFQTVFDHGGATDSTAWSRAPIDLWLDATDGRVSAEVLGSDRGQAYLSRSELELALAHRVGVDVAGVVVTPGVDDAIDRVCRGFLEPGRSLVTTAPGGQASSTYAQMAGADVRAIAWWGGDFPWEDLQAEVDETTAVVAIVSPNSVTGEVVAGADVVSFARANPEVLFMLNLAYVDFSWEDMQAVVTGVPNIVTVRTLFNGLSGLGYAVGAPCVIRVIRSAGVPHPVAAGALALATRALELKPDIATITSQRETLTGLFRELGVRTTDSSADFVFAEVGDGQRFRDGMAGFGIGVSAWPRVKEPDLDGWVRVTCPGDDASFCRLIHAIKSLERPDALIFDMDGVLVDVSTSYRQAIVLTAATFGVTVRPADIAQQKARGNANNDWHVTLRLLSNAGVDAELDEVTRRFEEFYQGTGATPGLWTTEKPLTDRGWISRLKLNGYALGVVTGRPRRDAERLIDQLGMEGIFETMVCMEDGPPKPDPWPIQEAMSIMGVETAWMFGDTRDDIVSSRAAGALPVGVLAPGDTSADVLFRSGAGFVVRNIEEIEDLLPESR